ncbi:O-methyltransferase, putative [Rhizoctonia solani AG-3 Rhs1AP]|uniref:O-methyltransferase, putative n=1 Tax=Rhizoctonia solani AG-3 Rhs1AP TaxID=1086054 RepID=X8JV77_9AGAM|nr:O-methyltransferase, putative [Rhizoctonia solani AG-3 Rhs1AP]
MPRPSIMAALDLWAQSDVYHNKHLLGSDTILEQVLSNSNASGLMPIAVSTAQGKFLNLQVRALRAKKILEVGTLGGYSSICMARALPEDGKLVTLEISSHNAEVARKNIELAGLSNRIEVKVGPAAETLPTLGPDHSFDFAFIDADKESNTLYFKEAQRLVKPGGVVIVDNVVRRGRVSDDKIKEEEDSSIRGVRELLRYVQSQPTVEATTMATVGEKGYDGFMYSIVGLSGSTRL